MLNYIIREKEDWNQFVLFIHKNFREKRIFLLKGNLGAGKTTFVQAFCKMLNCSEHVTSPTFSILNIYHDDKKNPIYHFDLYRLKSLYELKDIGFEDYLYSGNYCFIEWPDLAIDLIKSDDCLIKTTLEVNIQFIPELNYRDIFIKE
ncbi:MAG: hypothetical protein KatS3mg027_0782 [Bacteroidia bacterium]|nr:MAG: hypothetical protein KatS3mg027_0782 [Bacteroidia bacterium]